MKPFTQYLQEMNKLYEFSIRLAGCDLDKQISEQLTTALSAYAVESVGKPRRLPVQEHIDFPTMGPCECHVIEVSLKYPTTSDQVLQVVAEKLNLPRNSVLVRTKNEDMLRTPTMPSKKDKNGSVLTQAELEDIPDAQALVGQQRKDSMLKELVSRKYEFAAKEAAPVNTPPPQGKISPVGSYQNSIPTIKRKK
jgi:hypothetical protein